jgi:hypothetical protein
MPYSDLPEGAQIVNDPGQYSDLPQGATIVSHPQFNDVGAAAHGTPYSQSQPKPQGQGALGRLGTEAALGLTSWAPAVAGHVLSGFGMFPNKVAQSQTDLANQANQYGQELEAGTPSALGLPSNAPAQGLGGWGTAANVAGQMAPMALGAESTGVPALTKALMGYLPEASTALGRLGTSLAGGGIGAGLFGGITSPAMQPTPEGQSYGGAAARNVLPSAAMGAAFGGGLSALGEIGKIPSNIGKSLGTASAQEVLDELGSRLGGKSPGQALQDAANTKYNNAWDEFSKAVAPVDSEAANAEMDYSPAITKLKSTLGIGEKQSPMAMPDERRKVLTGLLGDLQEAQDPNGSIDNSFAGAMGIVKKLGAAQRTLAQVHGDTEARGMLGDVRDSILDSMNQSNPALADSAKAARQVFATRVAPLFNKSEGGQFLTQIRDTPTPNDLIGSLNQGALTRMKSDKMGIIANGSSADPLLYSMLDSAINQSGGNPGAFVTSIHKAMPAVEQIADPSMAAAFHGLERIASTANWSGRVANVAAGAAIGTANPVLGGLTGATALFSPKISGPHIIWELLQNPATQRALQYAAKMPAGAELNNLAGQIAQMAGLTTYPFAAGMHHPKTLAEYNAVPSGDPYQSISGAEGVKP